GSEIFDKQTLKTLYKLANQGHLDILNGAISTGKEANVLKGIQDDGTIVAVKIYRIATSDFKKMQYYINGDPRFKARMSNKRQIIHLWTSKEFKNLNRLFDAGVNVPKPITSLSNVLIIEFIGDENGNPAPLLRNKAPKDPEEFFEKLINQLKMFIKDAKLVHGDLSGFNILNHNENPVIIDVSQSVTLDNPIANELLIRDINNIVNDFNRFGLKISKEYVIDKLDLKNKK
ncbi:MAG: serine protein kinase RIO, partial [Methanobacteriaceae archaeon]